MYILILEDEKKNFNRLKRLLEEIDATHHVAGPLASIAETVEWLQMNPAPDLILADIRLTDGLSFDALRQSSVSSPVIFTTAYDEYAIKAFKFNSFDYLLKPINADELAVAIQKVNRYSSTSQRGSDDIRLLLEHMRKNNYRYRERFLLPYRDGYISVSVKDISHVALDGRNVCLYMKNGTNEKISYSLDELEKQLNPDEFFRVNRQYIVRIDSILSINNWFNSRLKVHLKKYPDTEVVVSRERATALKEWLDR
jgi:two-component system response regulator LytT